MKICTYCWQLCDDSEVVEYHEPNWREDRCPNCDTGLVCNAWRDGFVEVSDKLAFHVKDNPVAKGYIETLDLIATDEIESLRDEVRRLQLKVDDARRLNREEMATAAGRAYRRGVEDAELMRSAG